MKMKLMWQFQLLMSALEPLMIVFLGGTVGIIVVSMYLPMFKLVSSLAG